MDFSYNSSCSKLVGFHFRFATESQEGGTEMTLSQAQSKIPKLEVIHYSDSQPLTPEEQFVVMTHHEEQISQLVTAPTEIDLEVGELF